MSATGPIVDSFSKHFIERWNFVKKEIYALDAFFKPLGERFDIQSPKQYPAAQISAQLCRSASPWSQGLAATEKSIQNAYISLIENAERMPRGFMTDYRFHLHREPVLQ